MKLLKNSEYQELVRWKRCADRLVNHLQDERLKNQQALLRLKGNKRPNEKQIYALEMVGHKLAEIQNRLLDGEWI